MAKSRRSHRSRKSRKGRSRRMRGGQAPVNYSNPGPMNLNLEQGKQFNEFHKAQHGGALNTSGAYPGVVEEASVLPSSLVASAKLTGLNESFDYIKQFGPSSDNPNLRGGRRRRRGSRKSRKSRKGRKQRGGVLVRWGGGGRKGSRKSRKGRKASRKGRKSSRRSRRMRGGSYAEMRFPMAVADESKMLLPSGLASQAAGAMNPEWRLAENPMSFAPKM
jgi:hypothetical protein